MFVIFVFTDLFSARVPFEQIAFGIVFVSTAHDLFCAAGKISFIIIVIRGGGVCILCSQDLSVLIVSPFYHVRIAQFEIIMDHCDRFTVWKIIEITLISLHNFAVFVS